MQASSSREWGLLFLAVHRLLIAAASRDGARTLAQISVVVVHGLGCPMACGIFSDQGLKLRPLHWQVVS